MRPSVTAFVLGSFEGGRAWFRSFSTTGARCRFRLGRRRRRNHLASGDQSRLDELFLGDSFKSAFADFERSAVRFSTNRAARAHADLGTEQLLDRFARDPHAVGFRWLCAKRRFVDFTRLENGLDSQRSQRDGEFGHCSLKLATGITAPRTRLAVLD